MALEKFSTWIFYISVLLVIATMYTVAFVNRKELSVHEVLTNLAYDNITKTIFIGGENVLLKASENLAEHKRQATGPNLDYVDCYHDLGGTCAGENRNNVNKLLLIDSSKRRLIVCGSFNHGVCQIRSLDTLEVETNGTDYVVSSVPLQAEALITPSVKSSGTRAIYVATSWDKKYFKNPLNFLNPALSTRVIDELMNIFKPVKDDSSKSYIQYKENVVYYAKFIYAFSAGIFNYFVSVQQTTESYKKCNGACSVDQAIFKTFIVRVCQEDEVYASYMELPLDCKGSNGTSFNIAQSAYLTKAGDGLAVDGSEDVLVVTFFKADQGWSGPSQSSAVCIFSVKEIKTALVSNLKNCVNNAPDEEISLPWFPTHVLACEKEQSTPTITENFCPTSTFYAYHPFRGKTPLTKRSVMQYEKGMLTAVAAMPYYNHTVIFAGTDSGQLLKFSVEDEQQQVDPYSELKISSDEVRRIIVTSNQQHLYILSKHKVTKLPVEDCSTSESCDRCTKPNDPFCGWCTLYKRCSQKTSCPSADAHPLRYVTEPSNCPLFASISPEKVPHGPSIELTVKVSNVPPLAGLKCFVNGKEQKPTTVGPGNELKCQTPPEKDLPSITSDTGDVWVDLALYSTESQLLFLVKKLAFYSCPAIKGCINCAEGNYSCNWCTYLGRCTSNSSVDCQGEFIMPPQERAADSKGCPQIIADKSLFVPAQVNTSISVPAKNLPPEKGVASYKCVVTVDGSRKTSVAYRISDTELKCSPLEYFYKASIKKQEVKLEVIFRNSDVLYTPNTFKVYLYKCWVSITDCSSCHVEADADYQCGWCKSVSKCVVQKACGEGGAWIPPTSRCLTKPNISKVWPLTGPVTGGTEIEIHGSDLGKNFDNIKDSVMVAGMKCYPDQTKYQPSKRIFCNTSNSTGPLSGPVSVKVNKIEGKSKQLFSYQIPEPIDFNPKKGPRSGGTTVKIAGLKMNTGRHITAMVAGRKCVVDRAKVTNNSISCTISRAFSRRKRNAVNASTGVTVSFDGFTPTGPRGIFVFTPDPTVTSIEPDEVFFGGGLMLRISGTNLDTIQKPRMYLAYFSPNGTTKLNITVQECESKSSTLMECLSPKVPDFVGNVSKVQVQFLMDADIPLRSNYTSLTMIPNPFFEHFEDNLFVLKTENLILEV
ncbi:Plexin-A3 [Stylophora pistillata]|uniref:Plexin-A3 n=1 Tax=Stylophora pistillata TaxID=50429 RepID=A0A2B4SJ14_STYPI|nr:Plexin-A3 [Stylophora pistillata]